MIGRFVRRQVGRQVLKRVGASNFTPMGRMQALSRLPTLLRLGLALIRDARVPRWQKIGVLAFLGLIFSPLDFVGDIPVIGQFWDFTLAVGVLDAFIQRAPAHVVNEHIVHLRLQHKVPLRKL